MIYAVGHVCGAHFNPAVTVAFAGTKRFPWSEVPAYVGSQCLAALGVQIEKGNFCAFTGQISRRGFSQS